MNRSAFWSGVRFVLGVSLLCAVIVGFDGSVLGFVLALWQDDADPWTWAWTWAFDCAGAGAIVGGVLACLVWRRRAQLLLPPPEE